MFSSNCSPLAHYIHKLQVPYPSSHRIIPPIHLIIYPTMESADARVALLSFYLSRNAGIKSVPPSPSRRGDGSKGRSPPGKVPQRSSTLKRPRIDLFGAGGQTIYGVSEGCPTLAALGRIEAVEEQRRMQFLEAQGALMDRLHAGEKEREGEVKEGEDMFVKYIDIDKCI